MATLTSARATEVTSAQIPIEVVLSSGIHEAGKTMSSGELSPVSETHAQFEAKVMRGMHELSLAKLARQLTQPDAGILRAKGYVLADDGKRYLLQMVGTSCEFLEPGAARKSCDAGNAETAFVVIGLQGQMQLLHIDGVTAR